jgi:hypothetical protein
MANVHASDKPNVTVHSHDLKRAIDDALRELETLADEIRVKLHLAGMDANDTWDRILEPRLFDALEHGREAKASSAKAVTDLAKALREFAASL